MWKYFSGLGRRLRQRPVSSNRHVRYSPETLLSALTVARDALRRGTAVPTTMDVVTVDGTWRLTATEDDLWGTAARRQRLLHAVQAWCLYRGATEMVITTHVARPTGIMVIGVTSEPPATYSAVVDWYDEVNGAAAFDGPEWLTSDDVDDDIKGLLPTGLWELERVAADDLAQSALLTAGVLETELL